MVRQLLDRFAENCVKVYFEKEMKRRKKWILYSALEFDKLRVLCRDGELHRIQFVLIVFQAEEQ